MKFGWINLFGAVVVTLMLIPNIIYALKSRKRSKAEAGVPKYLSVCEQVGRYGCIVLMCVPVFVRKFGFGSSAGLIAYFLLNGTLLIAYYAVWISYGRGRSQGKGTALAVIPAAVFLLSGLLLRHWSLAAFALIFGLAHVRITRLTHK